MYPGTLQPVNWSVGDSWKVIIQAGLCSCEYPADYKIYMQRPCFLKGQLLFQKWGQNVLYPSNNTQQQTKKKVTDRKQQKCLCGFVRSVLTGIGKHN